MEAPQIKQGSQSYSKLSIAVFFLFLLIVFASRYYSFLLFHSLAEILSVIIAGAIFVIIWDSKSFSKNYFLLFIGIATMFIGLLDIVHTLAYKGMNIFTGFNANLATQLWIAARFLQAISLLVALRFLHRKYKPGLVFISYSLIISLLLLTIFYWRIFPVCYIDGQGLTIFKKIAEYVISILLIIFWILLYRQRQLFRKPVFVWLSLFVFFSVVSELAFTFYVGVYDLSNLIGHLFKIAAFYSLYVAIVQNTILFPFYELVNSLALKQKELESFNKKLFAADKKMKQNYDSLERMNKFMTGRELKMVELKTKIKELENNNK